MKRRIAILASSLGFALLLNVLPSQAVVSHETSSPMQLSQATKKAQPSVTKKAPHKATKKTKKHPTTSSGGGGGGKSKTHKKPTKSKPAR